MQVVYHASGRNSLDRLVVRGKNARSYKAVFVCSLHTPPDVLGLLFGRNLRHPVMIPRRRTLKIILQNAFFFMVFWAGLSAVQGSEGIGRSFGPIDLGMNPEALQKAVPSEERNDMYLHLLPGEQFFLVAEAALPDGIVNVGLRFFQGRLFKISVEYDLNWFSEDEWLLLLEKEMDEYGRISIDKKQIAEGINEMARWEDDTTVYILRRQLKMRFKDKKLLPHSNVFSIYIDKSLWNERTKLESQSLF